MVGGGVGRRSQQLAREHIIAYGQTDLLVVTKRRSSGVNEGVIPCMNKNESWRIARAEGSVRERALSAYVWGLRALGNGKTDVRAVKNLIRVFCDLPNSIGLDNMYFEVNTIMKPTKFSTQGQPNPRKTMLKVAFGPLFPRSKYFFVGWD